MKWVETGSRWRCTDCGKEWSSELPARVAREQGVNRCICGGRALGMDVEVAARPGLRTVKTAA